MRTFLLAFLFLPLLAASQTGKPFVIDGYLKGLPDGTTLILQNEELGTEPLAKAVSKAGKFQLKGQIPEPNIYNLSYSGSAQKCYMFLDPAKMQLTGNKDSLPSARLKGSASNEEFKAFQKQFNPVLTQLGTAAQQINNGEPDPGGTIRRSYSEAANRLSELSDAYVAEHPHSYVSPLAILVGSQVTEDITKTEERYNRLGPEVREGAYGRMLSHMIEEGKIGAVGTQAIDFTQNDTTGNPVTLSSFRGKYVLVDFWASWCRPCRQENPNVLAAYKQYNTRNFTVLGVSLDRARQPWIQAIQEDGLTWTHVSDLKFWNNEVAAKYKIQQIPQNLLLDPSGKIIGKNLRGPDLQARLKGIFN
jgi:peroxiredoxin